MTKLKFADTWNLQPLLKTASDQEIAADHQAVRAAATHFASIWSEREDYLSDLKTLGEALSDYEAWQRNFGVDGKSGAYFYLRTAQDQIDPLLKAKMQQATDFANEIADLMRFFELRIGKMELPAQTAALASSQLAPYHHFLERQYELARHQLSEAEERIMAQKAVTSRHKWIELSRKAFSAQERTITMADGARRVCSTEELMSLLSDQSKSVRDGAAEAFNNCLDVVSDIAEAEMNAILADHKLDDKLRGFTRPDAARHLSDDIDSNVVDVMLDAVTKRNNLARRYYRFKADLLGLPKLAYHERNLEFGSLDKAYNYAAASAIVTEVYGQLDPDFADIFRRFQANGQIDVYPRKGKTGGAFCAYFLHSQPTYILLNFTGKLSDVTTLGHEFGHGLNDEYMRQAQNSLNFGTPMATAEVASQYLEDFILDRLESEADDELRLAIMVSRLNDAVSSIFRQVACYRFEAELHQAFREQGYLSKQTIGEIFARNMSAYMGEAVEQSDGSENWWVYWGHIRNFFYVYSYASGLLIAKAMQRETRADKAFIGQVKTFLSAGQSASPKAIFAAMAIDITDATFWEAGLDEIEQLMNETEALAHQLGKLPNHSLKLA